PQHVRHASLKVRIDSANHDDAPGPAPPKTAEPRPQAVHSPSPRPPTGSVAPIVIKRTTSFSQRIHSLLHREKSQKHSPGTAGHETPTIAYRTPTSQTQSTNVSAAPSAAASADNSPPSGISPHASLVHVGSEAAAYRAQRSFEPVPEDNVFAVSYTNLRSVNRHSRQLQQAIQSTVASPADELVGMVDRASIASKRLSGHPVSREPSQTTLLRQPSAADADSAAAVAGTPPDAATAPVATRPSDDSGASSSMLAGKTLAIRPPRPLSLSIDTARNQEQLAAGPTREHHLPTPPTADVCPSPHIAAKKAVYSTHKASLNQFGRQTKVIGTGTGGTVRLLQGADLCVRPPSLRSGPASSHPGDDPCAAYVPSQHKLFAVKEFRKRRAEETPRAYMKKVTSEFCIGSSIHHENVIETLDLIFEGDRVYEIMEYCPHDLFTFVVNANMDLDETFCWFKQVCQGVQYLHRIGIAHRDL
ncbi:serine/threonine protein kinase, partial [Coemansia spiralis]